MSPADCRSSSTVPGRDSIQWHIYAIFREYLSVVLDIDGGSGSAHSEQVAPSRRENRLKSLRLFLEIKYTLPNESASDVVEFA
jgi:hypothetical protein